MAEILADIDKQELNSVATSGAIGIASTAPAPTAIAAITVSSVTTASTATAASTATEAITTIGGAAATEITTTSAISAIPSATAVTDEQWRAMKKIIEVLYEHREPE
jgi:hypothetical protein